MEILFVTYGKLLRDTTAGGDFHLLDLLSVFASRGITVFLAYPEGHNPCRLYLRRYHREGTYDESVFDHGKDPEASFRSLLGAFPGRIVHFQHFQTLPLSFFAITKEAGKRLMITIHDYFLWCQNFFLLSPVKGDLPSFCSFEKNAAVCASCLNSGTVRDLIYGTLWKDEAHSATSVQARRAFIGSILSQAELLVAPTSSVRENLLWCYPDIRPDRFVVVEHGVPRYGSPFPPAPFSRRTRLGVGFLGGFKFEKGSAYFNKIISSDCGKNVTFSIIGNVTTPVAPSVSSPVHLHGRYERAALPSILRQESIDVVLLLSPGPETYSYTLSDAIMSGIPVIATDAGAFRERVARHGVGFLVPYDNPVPRVVHLIRDLSRNPHVIDFFGRRCVDAARSMKDVGTMVAEYASLYTRLCSEGIS